MRILFLTVFLSLCLAGLFMVFFLQDHRRRARSSAERDALLPFLNDSDPPSPGS